MLQARDGLAQRGPASLSVSRLEFGKRQPAEEGRGPDPRSSGRLLDVALGAPIDAWDNRSVYPLPKQGSLILGSDYKTLDGGQTGPTSAAVFTHRFSRALRDFMNRANDRARRGLGEGIFGLSSLHCHAAAAERNP